MATVFERLEEQMKKLVNAIEEIKENIQENTTALENLKGDLNTGFLNFSDMMGNRLDEIEEIVQSKDQISNNNSGVVSAKLEKLSNDMKNIVTQIKTVMDSALVSIRKITVTPAKIPIAKPISVTSKPSRGPKPTPVERLTPSKRAPIPIKVGKTVPVEVLELLDSLRKRIDAPAVKFADYMEYVRDEIVRIYKFHPAIYELGTFARKLKKYPAGLKIDADILELLYDKIEEWKKRIGGLQ